MERLIDANKIIFHEIDEIGGEYWPYLGCSKDQIYSLPPVEAIPKAEYEARLKADMEARLDEVRSEIEQEYTKFRNKSDMWNERACGLGTALEIIDKHKSESGG